MTGEGREARVRCGKHWLTRHKFVHHAHPHSSITNALRHQRLTGLFVRPHTLHRSHSTDPHRLHNSAAPQGPQQTPQRAPQHVPQRCAEALHTLALGESTIESQLCQLCVLMRTLERGTPVDDIHRMSCRADREWNGTCFRLSSMVTPALPESKQKCARPEDSKAI